MNKPGVIIKFTGIYFAILILGFLVNQLLFPDAFGSTGQTLLGTVAQLSLVNFEHASYQQSTLFIIYSLASTQLAGTMWFTILLRCYWQLFHEEEQRTVRAALFLTLKVSLIIEGFLLIFFFYAIPSNDLNLTFPQKLLAALTLSINSFHNAGIGHALQILSSDLLHSSYVLQLGIIAGSILGSLGIFVLFELFAPVNLRNRLAHPEVDWSFMTKISVFGAAGIISIGSFLFFISELNIGFANRNLMEAMIASTLEICSARGFGYYLIENGGGVSAIVLLFANLTGSGPFATGGGLTLLAFPFLFWMISKRKTISNMNWKLAYQLAKNLLIYCLALFILTSVAKFMLGGNQPLDGLLYKQWMLFSCNTLPTADFETTYFNSIADSFTIIAGRVSFVVACFLTLKQKSN